MEGEFLVQRAALNSTEWKTVCRNKNKDYAKKVFDKQLQVYSMGQFRLIDPEGLVLEKEEARPLFS